MLEKELETAINLARAAGSAVLDVYATEFVSEAKIGVDNYSEPVTVADRHASRLIVDALAVTFPDDAILSEEEADDLSIRLSKHRVWIIDPIDGTAGFISKDGDFGVQIGLAEKGVPVLGVVFLPFHDILVYAVKARGTFMVKSGGAPVRMHTSDRRDFRKMAAAVSRHHRSPRMLRIIEQFGFARTVSRGSVGLKISLLIDQTCDFYVAPGPRTKLWDTCAPQIILEEAGGRLTDLFGLDLHYDLPDLQNRNGLLATNGAAHTAAVARLEPLLREFGRIPHPY